MPTALKLMDASGQIMVSGVITAILNGEGSFIKTEMVSIQPFASVTVMEVNPAPKSFAVLIVEIELSQSKKKGPVPC